ncbi:MAG: hypothetical protein AAF437_08970 [Pseudomonadota bacterium]
MGRPLEYDILHDMRWIAVLFTLSCISAAAAEEAHLIAFTEGRYAEAASVVETSHAPDALAFAARSLLAEAISDEAFNVSPVLIEQAEQLSREALIEAPDHIEARLQLAIALSLKARPMTTRDARRAGYGDDAKRLADSVLEDDPTNTYAHGFLSVWHIEVRRRGGAIGASIMGASIRTAREHYQAAIRLSPDDASVHWQYARALASLNAKKYRREIESALAQALDCGAETRLEQVMQTRARVLQSAIRTEKRAVVEELAAQML